MYIHNSIYMNQTASNTTQSKKKKKNPKFSKIKNNLATACQFQTKRVENQSISQT